MLTTDEFFRPTTRRQRFELCPYRLARYPESDVRGVTRCVRFSAGVISYASASAGDGNGPNSPRSTRNRHRSRHCASSCASPSLSAHSTNTPSLTRGTGQMSDRSERVSIDLTTRLGRVRADEMRKRHRQAEVRGEARAVFARREHPQLRASWSATGVTRTGFERFGVRRRAVDERLQVRELGRKILDADLRAVGQRDAP